MQHFFLTIIYGFQRPDAVGQHANSGDTESDRICAIMAGAVSSKSGDSECHSAVVEDKSELVSALGSVWGFTSINRTSVGHCSWTSSCKSYGLDAQLFSFCILIVTA